MVTYIITFRKRASKEYLATIDWYKDQSFQACENFIETIQSALKFIADSPYTYRNSYKNFREFKIKKFPFTVVYLVDEEKQFVIITSIFHNKRNPAKKFR